MNTFPLFFKFTNQPILIVGGGEVAQRKADLLSRAGANITVIAPSISHEIKQLLSDEKHTLIQSEYDKKYLQGMRIVIAGTNNESLNHQVHADCKALNIPVNVVDTPALCDFIFPAIVDRSPLVIGISSNGKAPVLARLTRARLETLIPQGYGKLAKLAGDMRDEVKSKIPTLTGRRQFWERAFEGKVSDLMFAGREADAKQALEENLAEVHQYLINSKNKSDNYKIDSGVKPSKPTGEVYIVGAGPGDPELLTFKALRLMQQADIVYHDALVSDEVLDLCRRDADKVYVGKKRSNHTVAQQNLNQLLIDSAKQGKRVVRLKGGDPFVFGRGGEEIQALRAAGIDYQVVPGITAAGAASCYTGMPLTHRDHAQSVRFVTGFLKSGKPNRGFETLINPEETLVFYMGLHSIGRLTAGLMDVGRDPNTPIAIVSHATRPTQQVMIGTLQDIEAKSAANPLPTPALLIVGNVVNLHKDLAWFGDYVLNTDQQAHALNMV